MRKKTFSLTVKVHFLLKEIKTLLQALDLPGLTEPGPWVGLPMEFLFALLCVI